jgi:hypothetical protein
MEEYLLNIIDWDDIPTDIQEELKGANLTRLSYYNKIIEYHISQRVRWRGSEYIDFYKDLLRFMRMKLQVYPYHLCKALTVNNCPGPFEYYIEMICDCLRVSKPYEEIPNFTAADILRLLGIQSNSYLETLQKCKQRGWAAKISKAIRGLLPSSPIAVPIEHWWIVYPKLNNSKTNQTRKNATRSELTSLQQIYAAYTSKEVSYTGLFDKNSLEGLFKSGVIEFEIPIEDSDRFEEPPQNVKHFLLTENLTDDFEKHLSRIFGLLSNSKTVFEISMELNLTLSIVKDALGLLCRLGFTDKILSEEFLSQEDWNSSWMIKVDLMQDSVMTASFYKSFQMSQQSRVDTEESLGLSVLIDEATWQDLNDIVNIEDKILTEDLKRYMIKILSNSTSIRLKAIRCVLESFLYYNNFDLRPNTSKSKGSAVVLSQHGLDPVIFTQLPLKEWPIYRMFKLDHCSKGVSSQYYPKGKVITCLSKEFRKYSHLWLLPEEGPYQLIEYNQALPRIREILPKSSIFLVGVPENISCNPLPSPQLLKIPLPLNICGITNRTLADFLRDLNISEKLEFCLGYIEVLYTPCSRSSSVLTDSPCCPQEFFLVSQHHGLPLHLPMVCKEIMENIKEKDWFKYIHLKPVSECQQTEVFQFLEFMCKQEGKSEVKYLGSR